MYYPNSREFQFFVEIELHRELLLSPIITNDPEEADFFYVPIYTFACIFNEKLQNVTDLIKELRSIGPWYDRHNGADHIMVTGFETPYGNCPLRQSVTSDNFIIASPNPQSWISWQSWHGQRNIIVPFVSYFPEYPFDQVQWNIPRKHTAFIAQTYTISSKGNKVIRTEISNQMRKLKRGNLVMFNRYTNQIVETVASLPKHMQNSDFCICPGGDLPFPKRFFDATYFGCIPVIISNEAVPPFADLLLDYSKFSLRIPEENVTQMAEILESFSQERIQEMRNELKLAAKTFRFRLGSPPVVGEAFWAFTWMLYIRYMYHEQFN
ncbi:Exostosin family protein [Histomonas meleagridis]|uniref:Exostosin family protein n=1 Tax=Histomonas meleagridis TaxID=135588 RepID=UPI003559C51A|nr:Exostosin family protein [Histomonas meleagridis]KAH0803740.1 Exostosin family protein [Histomonas meleagridis]